MIRVRTATLLVLTLLGACTLWNGNAQTRRPGDRPGLAKLPGDERTPPKMTGEMAEPTVTRKRVKSKEEPVTLIADDNMRCVVNEKRFKNTGVGSWTYCPWTY
jgi:hypothetical protein